MQNERTLMPIMKTKTTILLCILISCSNHNAHEKINNSPYKTDYQMSNELSEINKKILELIINSDSSDCIEFPSLYSKLSNKIPNDSNENLIIASYLKSIGFKVTEWGRGNYPPLGPRIVSLTLVKENCKCTVDKIYYSTISDTLFSVSERIKCNKFNR
jgi:hypothetical protein